MPHTETEAKRVMAAFVGIGLTSSVFGPFYAEQLDFESELYYVLGDSLDKRNRRAEAIGAYSKAISLRPEYVEVHHNLGLLLVEGALHVCRWKNALHMAK